MSSIFHLDEQANAGELTPYVGLVQISSAPLHSALAQLRH